MNSIRQIGIIKPMRSCMRRVTTAVCLVLVAQIPARADDALPVEVQILIKKAIKNCDNIPVFETGFLIQTDINADGRKDYILSYGYYKCSGKISSLYCGPDGCLTTVFASLPGGGYATVVDEKVRGLTFKRLKGRSAMVLDVHGTACGKTGAEACGGTFYWDGFKFSPAN